MMFATRWQQSGLPAHALQLELTEGIFMDDVDTAVVRILALKTLGIGVSVDDFGTGYSSLAHLKRFPLDVLKIDRFFVKDLPTRPGQRSPHQFDSFSVQGPRSRYRRRRHGKPGTA